MFTIEKKSAMQNELEQKAINLEIKSIDDEQNIVEGYASTFGGSPDSWGDVVVEGAFSKTIQERGNRVKFLWQHRFDKPIGKVVDLKEDSIGLYFKAKISETEKGKEVMQLMKDGVIDRVSIGYSTVKSEYDNSTDIRYLKEVKLFEISAVTFPANDRAVITSAKNAQQMEEKTTEELLEETKTLINKGEETLNELKAKLNILEGSNENNSNDEEKAILDLVAEMKAFTK